jgi:preprotein translocase subunit YajC
MGFLPLILMFVVLYFVMIRPQMKRQKEVKLMIEALAVGDEVVTVGGLMGKVTQQKDHYITVELIPGTEVKMQKNSVTAVLPKGTIKAI